MAAPLANASAQELTSSAEDLFGSIGADALGSHEKAIESISPDQPLRDAASRLWWRQMGALPVLDGERLLGCLAEDDLLRVIAERLEERNEEVEEYGGDLSVWEGLLAGLSVGDAMSPRSELPVLPQGTSLLEALRYTYAAKEGELRRRYLLLVDDDDHLVRIVSIRDVARYLTALYDGRFPSERFDQPEAFDRASDRARRALDFSLGSIRTEFRLGHAPVVADLRDSGEDTVRKIYQGRRGYVVVPFSDGAPAGICTRRDVLRALKEPFLRLDGLRVGRMMSGEVKTVNPLITLCGLFKLMALAGCRHMPLLDRSDQVECVISMWEGVSLLVRGTGPE